MGAGPPFESSADAIARHYESTTRRYEDTGTPKTKHVFTNLQIEIDEAGGEGRHGDGEATQREGGHDSNLGAGAEQGGAVVGACTVSVEVRPRRGESSIGARPGAEETIFKVAHAYEQATEWHTMRPPGA